MLYIHICICIYCESPPLELRTADRKAQTRLKPGTSNSGAAILENGTVILCGKTAILCSEHSTAGPDLTSVTSSGQGYIRRAPVAATRPPRPPPYPAAATFRNTSTFSCGKGSYKVERQTLASSFSC